MHTTTLKRAFCCLLVLVGCPAAGWAQSTPDTRLWARSDYLLWRVKGADVPPLVTTGPVDADDPGDRPGEIGAPGTLIVFGDTRLGFDASSGGRFVAGGWLDDGRRLGIEATYLFLAQRRMNTTLSEPGTLGSTALLIPFFNPVTGLEDSTGIAVPVVGGFSGIATLGFSTRMWSANLDVVLNVAQSARARVDVLAGYRSLNLSEGFRFTTDSRNVPPLPPDIFLTSDEFDTSNHFDGGEAGVRSTWERGPLSIRGDARLALGAMRQTTEIRGSLVTNDFNDLGPVQTFSGAYFALPTNLGTHKRDRFAAVSEITGQLGWSPVPRLRLLAGYTFVFVSAVARPTDQIDRTINPSQGPGFTGDPSQQLAGPARPAFPGRDTTFRAQGLNLGVELRF